MALKSTNDALDQLWYIGMLDEGSMYYSQTEGTNVTWPYLPGALSSNNNNTNNNNNQGGWESVDWEDSSDNFLQMWLLFVTLLNNFVPLSLYVTLEIVTFSLMWFINNDRTMYHTKTDTAAVSRSTIVSDLGQVEYIFSDKTGTLTQNVMRFKRCSVDGMVFGAPIAKARPQHQQEQQESSPHLPLRALLHGSSDSSVSGGATGLEGMSSTHPHNEHSKKLLTFNAEMFLRILCICHTVVVEKDYDTADIKQDSPPPPNANDNDGTKASNENRKRLDTADAFDPDLTGVDGAPYGFAYQAESPDEGALVAGSATIFGFQLVGRSSAGITLQAPCESILSDVGVTQDIRSGVLSSKELASRGASQRRRLTMDSSSIQEAKEGDLGDTVHQQVRQRAQEDVGAGAISAGAGFDSHDFVQGGGQRHVESECLSERGPHSTFG